MLHQKLPIGALAILLVASVCVSAFAPEAGSSHRFGSLELAEGTSNWQQVNSNGFGDPHEQEVSALEAFNSQLYAGTYNMIDPLAVFDGARIFRSPDGVTWTPVTQPGFQNPHDTAPSAILDFLVFNNRLYASTGRGGNAAQIWRTLDGVNWAPIVAAGFGDPEIHDIAALGVHNGAIYAGASSQVSGARIYRSSTGDSNTWSPVAPAAPTMPGASVTGFAQFDGALWATIESEAPLQIWRSTNGSTWTSAVNNGFGDSNTVQTGGMAVFGNHLYVGAGNTTNGAQLWRTNGGGSWEPVINPGLGDANNLETESVFAFDNQLYVSVKNKVTGVEIWRSGDGTTWEQSNQDGFGNTKNTTSNQSSATAAFLSQLYIGTSNVVDGGELWRMLPQASGPAVLSVTRANPDPTSASSVDFTVTFSVPVTGVDGTDFSISKTGSIRNYAVSNVSPSNVLADTYTVTVNTGKFNGTLRLDVLNNGSIMDVAGNPLAAGYSSGEIYTVSKIYIAKFLSQSADDGWVLESTEASNIGGTMNVSATTFNVGDGAGDKQYRGILSFNTAPLPDNAVITAVVFKVRQQAVIGTNPFTTHGSLLIDIIKGAFTGHRALELTDFQAAASRSGMVVPNIPSAGWYSKNLPANVLTFINKVGVTQLRLRFTEDDNDDRAADFFKLYSGNAPIISQPKLVIKYFVP